jgi:hypothetical protein
MFMDQVFLSNVNLEIKAITAEFKYFDDFSMYFVGNP